MNWQIFISIAWRTWVASAILSKTGLFGSTDPDVTRSFEPAEFLNVVKDFEDYFAKLTEARRAEPQDDLATIIANAEIDGEQIPDLEANGYYMIIATAGHDTTSASTAGGLLALMNNP